MKQRPTPHSLFLLPLSLSFLACGSDDGGDSVAECQDTVCTLELRRIIIRISNATQEPVALDAIQVLERPSGNELTLTLSDSEWDNARETGQYPLIEDGVLGLLQETELQFTGFVNGQAVVSAMYTVGTDCCHINLIDVETDLSL